MKHLCCLTLSTILIAGFATSARSQTPPPDANPAQAAQPADWLKVEARFEAKDAGSTYRIGEPLVVEIEARHPAGLIALLPAALPLPAALAERVEQREHIRQVQGAEAIDRYRLHLLPFEAGALEVPAIELAAGSTTAATLPLSLLVESGLTQDELLVASSTLPQALAELEQMAATNPEAIAVETPDYTLFWVLGAIALAVLLFLLVKRLSQRPVEAKPEPPPPPPRPAHEVALERLADLKAADHLAQGDFKPHYTELSSILRAYVGGRYDFDSLDLTVDELMDTLRDKSTPGLDSVLLEQFLMAADQVKFAKFVPVKEDGYEALNQAEKLVHDTRAQDPAPPQEGSS